MTIVFTPKSFAISMVLSPDDESIMIISGEPMSCDRSAGRSFPIYAPAFNVGMITDIFIKSYFIIDRKL
jgi:hypothetical protein